MGSGAGASTSSSRTLVVPPRPRLEDCAGFTVSGWSAGVTAVSAPHCFAPWRVSPPELARLLVERVPIGPDDLFVDLGSGDGSLVHGVAELAGCRGVGVEASGPLVRLARAAAARLRDPARVRHLAEVIGLRGLGGATVVFTWMVPNGVSAILSLVRSAVDRGGVRVFATAGGVGEFARLGEVERIGSVPAPIVPPPARLAGLVWDRAGGTDDAPLISTGVSASGGADGSASRSTSSRSAPPPLPGSVVEVECRPVGGSVPVDVVRRFGSLAGRPAGSGSGGGVGEPL